MPPNPPPVAALVVGYHPDLSALDSLLAKLLDQADRVIFIDNGGGERFLAQAPVQRGQVQYVKLDGNQGLGYALNLGMEAAARQGYRFVATFDQDSDPPADMLKQLLAAQTALVQDGVHCAAVGPRFYDKREGSRHFYPMYREEGSAIRKLQPAVGGCPGRSSAGPRATDAGAEFSSDADACSSQYDAAHNLMEVDVLITSGMLVNMDAWESGLRYNEGLVVDYTDTDWCFRARAAGYRLYACTAVELAHALSDAPPIRVAGLNFLRYSPLRRYYYFRNTMFFIRQPYVSKAWRRRLMKGLFLRFFANLFIDTQKWQGARMMLRGICHGARNKLGVR